MRGWVTFLFIGLMLAGCIDEKATPLLTDDEPKALPTQPTAIVDDTPLFDPAGLRSSHPAFGFPTTAALFESPDGRLYDDLDDGRRMWYNLPYEGVPGTLRTMAAVGELPEVGSSGGIAVFGGLVFLGPRSGQGPLQVVNVMDPSEPRVLGYADAAVRDADAILYPDGRLVIISTGGTNHMFASDVTNPSNASFIGAFETAGSNHNIAVVPGTPIVYNSGMDIVDWSDPEAPVAAGSFVDGDGCHDITFSIDQSVGRYWAICAGYANSEIWDISDPFYPTLVKSIPYPSLLSGIPIVGPPAANTLPDEAQVALPGSFSHLAMVNHDATVLVVGDETGGGAINGCDVYYEGPDGAVYSGPAGNIWFYDITDPNNPVLHGHVSPSLTDADSNCTAHFGRFIEDTGFLVMAYYSAGIILVDFRDLDNPRIVDRLDLPAMNVWDVQFHQGYLFTGDMGRGMDAITLHG